MSFAQSLWLAVEIFFFLAYLVVLFQIVGDLFRDHEQSGWAKAVWIFFLVLVPLITALVYLIVRGKGMTQRQIGALKKAEAAQESYIRDVAGTSPAQELAAAKQLLDSGAITQAEFEQLKAKALA